MEIIMSNYDPKFKSEQPIELTVITFNIMVDFLSWTGVPRWDERKVLCAQALRQAQPSIIGLQEVTPGQFEFLQSHLPEFSAITITETTTDETLLEPVRRQYGLQTIPVPYEIVLFFRTEAFARVDEGYWWLSPTPEKISVGFGNIAPRAVLWARLRHKASGREFIVLNTHLDNRALRPMAQMCREKLQALIAVGLPLIFMGDFNIDPGRDEYALLTGNGWQDACLTTPAINSDSRTDSLATFRDGRRIDHILYHGDALKPYQWLRLSSPDPERRLSDHEPVLARLWLGVA
jgi:endonuclease/exonuclease/phosphatase family metal-dependent hydrolase